MSRLGRDYLKVGQVMEILRQRGVRLIAINDGVDSLKGDDDFTPFRNIMNEFYARDTSRKIRSVFKSKGMSGKHLTLSLIHIYGQRRLCECSHGSFRPIRLSAFRRFGRRLRQRLICLFLGSQYRCSNGKWLWVSPPG